MEEDKWTARPCMFAFLYFSSPLRHNRMQGEGGESRSVYPSPSSLRPSVPPSVRLPPSQKVLGRDASPLSPSISP